MNPHENSEISEGIVSASYDSVEESKSVKEEEFWPDMPREKEEVSTVNFETSFDSPRIPLKRKQRTWSLSLSDQLFSATKEICERRGLIIDTLKPEDISDLATEFSRTPEQCLAKIREILVSGSLKAGVWSKAEDEMLMSAVKSSMNWRDTANYLNAVIHNNVKVRSPKHCKERWNNHINPENLKGNWTKAEDLLLMDSYKTFHNKWTTIAKVMKNRSENSVKNRVHSLLHKIKQKYGITDNDIALQKIIKKLKKSN